MGGVISHKKAMDGNNHPSYLVVTSLGKDNYKVMVKLSEHWSLWNQLYIFINLKLGLISHQHFRASITSRMINRALLWPKKHAIDMKIPNSCPFTIALTKHTNLSTHNE